MKRMLKIFQVIGFVSLIAFITAVSCGKAGDGDNNNNNNGGGGGTPAPAIVVTNLLASVTDTTGTYDKPVKVDGTNISIKIVVFSLPSTSSSSTSNFNEVVAANDSKRRKVFDFAFEGSSGGLTLVAPGNVASVGDFTTPVIATTVPSDDSVNEGIFVLASPTANNYIAQGLNIYGVFVSKDANSLYAFSEATEASVGGAKPQFSCRAVAPEITTTTPVATATLKGGEKSQCFASRWGYASPSTQWLGGAARKSIEVAVGAVRTDGKKVSEIGITPAEFADGLSKADMAKLAAANKTDYKKFKITIVANNAF